MITKDQTSTSDQRAVGFAFALVVGIVVGLLVGGSFGGGAPEPDDSSSGKRAAEHPAASLGPFSSGGDRPEAAEGLGPPLELEFSADAAATLQAARQRALDEGVIRQLPGDEVRVTARVGDAVARGRARLKGDWLDHVETDKWSLRLQFDDGHVFGMSELSVQHPQTRGGFMEWFALEVGRLEGLLAPRCRFVDVVINGKRSGVYYLEEHFTKEMLESQGRRDGPIVRLLEDSLWSTWRQFGFSEDGEPLPRLVAFAELPFSTDAAAYDERRLAKVEALNDRLQAAIRKMRELQALMLGTLRNEPETLLPIRIRQLDAVRELQGRSIDDVFVAEKFGRLLALYTLFRSAHGLSWHQLRFYHDPVLDRLEPLLFDTGSTMDGEFGDVLMTHIALEHYMRSVRCRQEAFRALGRFVAPETLEGWLAALGPRLRRNVAALEREGLLAEGVTLDGTIARLRAHQDHLRAILTPEDPVNYACSLVVAPDADGDAHWIEVEAWPTTSIPVVVDGFRFGNGRFVPAARVAVPEAVEHDVDDPTRVVLSSPGRRTLFRIPADERLLQLRDVESIKRAIRQRAEGRDQNVKLELSVDWSWLHVEERREEKLRIRRKDTDLTGRPASPTLEDALHAHPFLTYDVEYDKLGVRPGSWDVDGDFVVPAGFVLEIPPDVTLRFSPGAVFASFETVVVCGGLPEHEVAFEARSPEQGWGGIVIADTGTRDSVWANTRVRSADRVIRGSWQTTGGITFYRAPVRLRHVRIEDARGEDALNVFGASVELNGCTIDGGPSDLFDGDFVRGSIRGCTFENAGEDGVDFSGSDVLIEACRFRGLGDKAVSVGENTHAVVRHCVVESASIGVAAKDLSHVDIEGLQFGRLENFGIAAFVKKPEYGASRVAATGLSTDGTFGRARYLVQTGCELLVDGVAIPTEDVDVADLYARKVLGK